MHKLATLIAAGALVGAVGVARPQAAVAQGALDTLGGAVEKGTKDAVKEEIEGAVGKGTEAKDKAAGQAGGAANAAGDEAGKAAGQGAGDEKAAPADGD